MRLKDLDSQARAARAAVHRQRVAADFTLHSILARGVGKFLVPAICQCNCPLHSKYLHMINCLLRFPRSRTSYGLGVGFSSVLVYHRAHLPLQIDGDWRYEARRSTMLWTIDLVDEQNRSGSMEFVVPACDAATFFPVVVNFTATQTLCDVQVRPGICNNQGQRETLLPN